MITPFSFMKGASGGTVVVDSIEWFTPAGAYTCAGSPVGLLPWGPTTGIGNYQIHVIYHGNPTWDMGAVTLTAAITSLTPTGGSDPVTGPGTLGAIAFSSSGAYLSSYRAIYTAQYFSPAKAGAGTQTAALVLSLLNAAVEVDVLNDSCSGDFACS